jgi:hypothetical protein
MPLRVKSNCPGGCCSLPTPTITCVSRNGNATLVGWSKLANHNSGDWNLRKYSRVTYAATQLDDVQIVYYTSTTSVCTGSSVDQTVKRLQHSDGTAGLVEDFGGAAGAKIKRNRYTCTGAAGPQLTSQFVIAPFAVDSAETSGQSNRVTTDTTDSVDYNLSSVACTNGLSSLTCGATVYRDRRGNAITRTTTSALSVPQTVHASGSGTLGSSCRTSAGAIANTAAGSETDIAITGTLSVRTTFACTGLTNGVSYDLSFTETQYSPGTSTVLNTFVRTVTFVASGSTANVAYDNVVNTDGDYECSAPSVAPS